jgi:hypothetical protein
MAEGAEVVSGGSAWVASALGPHPFIFGGDHALEPNLQTSPRPPGTTPILPIHLSRPRMERYRAVPTFFRRWFRSPTRRTLRRSAARRSQSKRLLLEALEDRAVPSFSLGAAADYAILFEGGGTNDTLNISNSTTNTSGSGIAQGGGIGNIGVGGSGFVSVTGGGSSVNGNIDFSASNTGQFSGISPSGGVNFNVPAVTSALSTVNALNTTLGALPGTSVAVNGNTTISASDGTFSASGTGYTNVRLIFDTAIPHLSRP